MAPKAYVLNARPIVLKISPFGLLLYAKEFLGAARALSHRDGFSPVPYYLLCHSIETGMKAFILAKGGSHRNNKRKLGHDLATVLASADGLGFAAIVPISPDERRELSEANAYYDNKGFEYFELGLMVTGSRPLPPLASLDRLADRIVVAVEPVAWDCIDEQARSDKSEAVQAHDAP